MARQVVIMMRGFKTRLRLVVAIPTLFVCLGGLGPPEAVALRRLPLQKRKIEIGQPAPMEKEFQGYDKDGNPVYWDPQPRVVPLGNGKFAFKWLGLGGRELTLIYERPDAVDVIVKASLSTSTPRGITYRYKVQALKTSGLPVTGFVVQTFSQDITSATDSATFTGKMASFIKEFAEGNWISFGPLQGNRAIPPGKEGMYALVSGDLPGVVACTAHGGALMLKIESEEPPSVLQNLFLGRDAWPHGYTIGPDERLAKMGLQGRLNYLIIRLPQMLELGWIENEQVLQWYKEKVAAGKTAEVRARAKADFDKKLITSEVLALMTYLTK
jgi:hypothetical protein